jgi:Ca2+-transporting ATPase
VVARVTPQDKMRIVLLLRAQGEVVAMVGDGINDAPALKVADVGVAVGAHASGVARQVADVVMASEDLRSILTAVGEGRIVQDNLRRTVRYLFATNLSEILLVLSGAALGVPTLGPMQLLWTNLVTDSLPALALALEPGDPRILDREPAPPGEPVVRPREWRRIVRDAAALAGLGGAALVLGGPTAAFAALPAAQIAYAESCRAPSAGNGTFAKLVGGAAALHAAAVLGTAGATPAVVAALAAGLAWPALGAWGRDEIVVKGGSP